MRPDSAPAIVGSAPPAPPGMQRDAVAVGLLHDDLLAGPGVLAHVPDGLVLGGEVLGGASVAHHPGAAVLPDQPLGHGPPSAREMVDPPGPVLLLQPALPRLDVAPAPRVARLGELVRG